MGQHLLLLIFPVGPIELLLLLFFLLAAAAVVGMVAFWIWMLVDCLTNEPSQGNDKIVWAVVIVVLPLLGPLLYFVIRRPERIRELGH